MGVGCPCRGGRPKKKNSWRGVGGEGAAPPPQMHSQNMLRDSPSARRIFGALCSPFLSVRGKTSCALRSIFFYVLCS